jgi:hypothetical protein
MEYIALIIIFLIGYILSEMQQSRLTEAKLKKWFAENRKKLAILAALILCGYFLSKSDSLLPGGAVYTLMPETMQRIMDSIYRIIFWW